MKTTITPVEVGDVMILAHPDGPVTVTVSKVTKAGWVRFAYPDGSESNLYKPYTAGHGQFESAGGDRFSRRRSPSLYVFSQDRMDQLTEQAAQRKAAAAAKAAEAEARRQEIEDQKAAELAELQQRLHKGLAHYTVHRLDLEDGGQVISMAIPNHPDLRKHCGPTRLVVIRISESRYFDEEGKYEAYPTWSDQGTTSFASCSAQRGKTIDEAVWAALLYLNLAR